MRAHTITIMSRRRRRARRRAIALVLAVCSLAIPASAGAYSSVNAITGGTEQSSQPTGGSDHSSRYTRTATELAQAVGEPRDSVGTSTAIKGGHDVIPGYASPNAITGAETPTVASGSPSGDDQWFDLPSALVGAGSAMALVALGAAAFLTVRRQREVSPSASTS
jgi:hypothetical protein